MITCNITYYNEPRWLQWWYDTFIKLHDEGIPIHLSIADDGSMKDRAEDFFETNKPYPFMSLYRVKDDLGFNSHGARNLLMQRTKTEWNMLSDIDRQYPISTFEKIAKFESILSEGYYYGFVNPNGGSLNDYVVSKNDFWSVGGYDEEFVNIHWGDRLFFESLERKVTRIDVSTWEIIYKRHARDVTFADTPITLYPSETTMIHPNSFWGKEELRHELKDRIRKRNSTEQGRKSKKVVNFEWTQIF